MKAIKLLSILMITFESLAQVDQDQSSMDAQLNISDLSMQASRTFDNRYEGMSGSPLLIPFSEGSVTFKGTLYDINQKKLGLDAVAGLLVMRESDQVYKVLNSDFVDEFTLLEGGNERKFIHQKSIGAFLEVLENADFRLLAKRSKKILKANYQGGFSANRPYDEITDDKDEYFIITANDEVIELGKKKKSILKGLSKVPLVRDYLVRQQNNLLKEELLIEALAALQ